jgi:hypothetical protein
MLATLDAVTTAVTVPDRAPAEAADRLPSWSGTA